MDELRLVKEETNEDDERSDFEVKIARMTPLAPLSDGVYKKMIKAGVGDVLTPNSSILYHCSCFLDEMEEPFDSTILRGRPYLHRLNMAPIVRGLYLGLMSMRLGEEAEFLVRPDYAFGKLGCPPRIPENSTILYVVQILKIFEEGTLEAFQTLSEEEKQKYPFEMIYEICDGERKSGNSYFKSKKYKESAFRYRKASLLLEQWLCANPDQGNQAKELLLKFYCNLANAYVKLQRPIRAMSQCKKVNFEQHKISSNYKENILIQLIVY